MLKKIALVGVFAVVSIVSFGTSSRASNRPAVKESITSIAQPRGLCPAFGSKCGNY